MPKGETEQNLGLMRQIDERRSDLETPFFGVRQMTLHLCNDGHFVNEKRIRLLMRLMGLMPIYRKPNTSGPACASRWMGQADSSTTSTANGCGGP